MEKNHETTYILLAAFSQDMKNILTLTNQKGPGNIIGKQSFPGGEVDERDGATAEQMASAKLKEQTGLNVPPRGWLQAYFETDDNTRVFVMTTVTDISKTRLLDDMPAEICSVEAAISSFDNAYTNKYWASNFKKYVIAAHKAILNVKVAISPLSPVNKPKPNNL